jgi:hypothetical protein
MKKVWVAGLLGILLLAGCSAATTTSSPPPSTTPSTSSITPPPEQEPVEVVSVTGPLPPINPGGPIVQIELINVSAQPVVSLTAVLGVNGAPPGHPFTFNFDVTLGNPLPPGDSTSARMTLIGGGFNSEGLYPLTVSGSFQDGVTFSYNTEVRIAAPPGA